MGHLVGGALVQQVAEGGVVQPLDGAALLPVRMVGDLFGIPHRLVVDVGLVQDGSHLLLGFVGRPFFERRVDLHLALGLDAGVVLGILLHQLAVAGGLAERGEILVVVRADQDIALLILLGVLGLRIGGLAGRTGVGRTRAGG